MSHILILTAGYGEGHNAAARNLAAAITRAPGGHTVKVADPLALASPRLNRLTRRLYLKAINHTPRLWSSFYAWIDRARPFPRRLGWLRGELRTLQNLLASESPDAICSTFPLYAFLLEHLAARGDLAVPHYNVVTDSISINSLWWLPHCDGWFLPNEDTARIFRDAGCPAALLHVTGFPVQATFAAEAERLQPPNLAAGHAPRVLYIINSGSHHAETTAHLLLAESSWSVTCAVGRDQRLRRRLEHLTARRRTPAIILGWTELIPQLLMTHHAVVSKAGGATTQEAIAARCPMIVNQIVPGQEEGNYELLKRHGIGALATSPTAVADALRHAFAGRGAVWRDWRRALDPLARPTAADDIARHILNPSNRSLRWSSLQPARSQRPVVSRHG